MFTDTHSITNNLLINCQTTSICTIVSHNHNLYGYYHLSKWPNCSHGTCSGLVIWQPRCTADTSSRTRHVILLPPPHLVIAPVTQNGGVNHITPVLSMTPVSVLALVPFPQLNLPVHSYR